MCSGKALELHLHELIHRFSFVFYHHRLIQQLLCCQLTTNF